MNTGQQHYLLGDDNRLGNCIKNNDNDDDDVISEINNFHEKTYKIKRDFDLFDSIYMVFVVVFVGLVWVVRIDCVSSKKDCVKWNHIDIKLILFICIFFCMYSK